MGVTVFTQLLRSLLELEAHDLTPLFMPPKQRHVAGVDTDDSAARGVIQAVQQKTCPAREERKVGE